MSTSAINEIKYRWVLKVDATHEWRPMMNRLNTKASEKKVTLVLDTQQVHNVISPDPGRPVLPPALPANPNAAQKNEWILNNKVYHVQMDVWKAWKKEQDDLSDSCSMATAILLEMFDDNSLIMVASEEDIPPIANAPTPVSKWIFLWDKLNEIFEPSKAADKWRIHAEWIALKDDRISFAEFKMKWDHNVKLLVLLNAPPTESDKELQLRDAITNPYIRTLLQEVLIEGQQIPLPVPRTRDLEWFWIKAMGLVNVDPTVRDYYKQTEKALWVQDVPTKTTNQNREKRKNPFEKKVPTPPASNKPGTTKSAGAAGEKRGNQDRQGDISKYGPQLKKPRSDSAFDPTTKTCYRCGNYGHVSHDFGRTKIICKSTKCSVCNTNIGSAPHDSRNCTGRMVTKSFSGAGARGTNS
jgi:hypothetical protein